MTDYSKLTQLDVGDLPRTDFRELNNIKHGTVLMVNKARFASDRMTQVLETLEGVVRHIRAAHEDTPDGTVSTDIVSDPISGLLDDTGNGQLPKRNAD